MQKGWVIGVDEAGRGPLAGPVAVGVACVPVDFAWELLPGVGDSKAVRAGDREAVARRAHALSREGILRTCVSMVGPKIIDERGINPSIRLALARALASASAGIAPDSIQVLLDGGLRAPARFVDQETIVRGDASEPVIGLASILAKVRRDGYMRAAAKRLPCYQFDAHKGYGTKAHREAIAVYGLSPLHRVTFCHNLNLPRP